ncbi:hypothetical protein PG996_015959 [Apiospora saccharicola]|uniref:F-box domain-containing protein n=1 Tax=Apiospora saccharicola TaxID=335842 RepID=A0ABR1TMK9_9PEZI
MASDLFHNKIPAEIIEHMMSLCASEIDAKSLAKTCHKANNVWLAGKPRIIWRIRVGSDTTFDLALTAVRATKIVKDSEDRSELPPKDMDPGKLSGFVTLPTLKELNRISELHQLVHALVYAFCVDTSALSSYDTNLQGLTGCPELHTRLRNAIYRVLICGAALAGAYTEPFHEAKRLGKTYVNDDPNYLEKFVVLALAPKQKYQEAVFESLATWLVEDILSDANTRNNLELEIEKQNGKDERCSSAKPCALKTPGKGDCIGRHLVYWSVMEMLWVNRHMWKAIHPFMHPFDWRSHWQVRQPSISEGPERPLTVPVVLFGRFRIEDVVISSLPTPKPTPPEDWEDYTDLTNRSPGRRTRIGVDKSVVSLLSWVHRFSPQHTVTSRGLTLPLDLAFLDYTLKKHAGVHVRPQDAACLVSPNELSGTGPNPDGVFDYACFFRTLYDFLGGDKLPGYPAQGMECLLVGDSLAKEYFDGWTKEDEKSECKDIGASAHLRPHVCPDCW